MKCTIYRLLLLLLLPGCSSESLEADHQLDDKQRTLNRLVEYHRESQEDHPHFGRGLFDRAEKQLARTPRGAFKERFDLSVSIGYHGLTIGENMRSVEAFGQALELLQKLDVSEKEERDLWFDLAVTWLRVAETANCIRSENCECCLFPVPLTAIHEQQQGSREAIVYLDRLLEKDPEHLTARWLLNIAHMTLGHSLDEIAEPFRLPAGSLESDIPFPQFTNVASRAGVNEVSLAGGAIADDFDNDQWIDLVVSNWNSNGQLRFFHNNGDGTFEDRSKAAGLLGFVAGLNLVQGDYDNDGDLDILVLRGAWQKRSDAVPNSLLQNDGRGRFTEVLYQAGLGEQHFATQTATWCDFDLDGDLDLFVGNENAPCQLFQNDGQGHFTDVAARAGVQEPGWVKGVASGDYDGDGDADFYVSNLGGDNRLYRNNGNGTFTDVASALGVTGPQVSFPTWFWDYNNDGALDIFAASYEGNVEDVAAGYFYPDRVPTVSLDHLYQADGQGGFRNVALESGLRRPTLPMGANFGDLNNDGYLDFYLGTGNWEFYGLMPNLMFQNLAGKTFADVTTAGGFGHLQKGHGVAFLDYDHDGDEDIFSELGGAYLGDVFQNTLFENPGFKNAWVKIRLVGTKSNRFGIGARIRVDVTTEGGKRSIYRWVGNGSSFGANSLRQDVGLGTADRIDRLEIFWPASKTTQVFENVAVRCLIEVTEGNDTVKAIPLPALRPGKAAAQ
ncbi:MAG: CRTAC1 family protein [Pirellulaceae bacterium]